MTEIIVHSEYEGPRWTYGLQYRPLGIGSVPKGHIVGSLQEHDDFRHGAVDYPRKLTEKEVASYELVFVSTTDPELDWERLHAVVNEVDMKLGWLATLAENVCTDGTDMWYDEEQLKDISAAFRKDAQALLSKCGFPEDHPDNPITYHGEELPMLIEIFATKADQWVFFHCIDAIAKFTELWQWSTEWVRNHEIVVNGRFEEVEDGAD